MIYHIQSWTVLIETALIRNYLFILIDLFYFFRLVKFKENSKNVVTTSVPNSMKIFKSSKRVVFHGTPMIWQRS